MQATDFWRASLTIGALTGGAATVGAGFPWIGFPLMGLSLVFVAMWYARRPWDSTLAKWRTFRRDWQFQWPIARRQPNPPKAPQKPKPPPPDITDLPRGHLDYLDGLIESTQRSKKGDPMVRMLEGNRYIIRKHDLQDGTAVYRLNRRIKDQVVQRRTEEAFNTLRSPSSEEGQFLSLFTHNKPPPHLSNEVYQTAIYLSGKRGILERENGSERWLEVFTIREGCRPAVEAAVGSEVVRESVEIDLNHVAASGNRGSGSRSGRHP